LVKNQSDFLPFGLFLISLLAGLISIIHIENPEVSLLVIFSLLFNDYSIYNCGQGNF